MSKKYKYYKNSKGARLRVDRIKKYYEEQSKTNEFKAKRREEIFSKSEIAKEEYKMSETKFQELNSRHLNIENVQSPKQLERAIKSQRRQRTKTYMKKKNSQYKKNYIEALDTLFEGKVDDSRLKTLKNKIYSINNDMFAEEIYKENIISLDVLYPENVETRKDVESSTDRQLNRVEEQVDILYNRMRKK